MDFVCPHCRTVCEGQSRVIGTEVRCPSCRNTFVARAPVRATLSKWGAYIACGIIVLVTFGILLWLFSASGARKVESTKTIAQQPTLNHTESITSPVPDSSEQTEVRSPSQQELLKRCVTITTVDSNASGFFFKRKGRVFVVTCNHVVFDQPFLIIHDLNGKEYPAERVYCAKDRDMAVVALKNASSIHVPTFEVEDDVGSVEIESELVCYGDSEGKGVIVRSEGKLLGIGPCVIETDTTIVPGNSGGPVILSASGKVVGIASHLTINSGTWVKGTRFDNQTRRFAVRMDNVNWEEIMEKGNDLLQSTDYHEIQQFAQDVLKGENGRVSDSTHAFYCSRWAASHGDAEAQTEIGFDYEWGIGVEQSLAEAIKWYQMAAEQKEPKAQRFLGTMYLKGGIFISANKEKAFELFMSAATAGDIDSMYQIGCLYRSGDGCEKRPDIALEYFRRASSLGHVGSMAELGWHYEFGIGTEQNYQEAKQWYQKGANMGDSFSLYRLGRIVLDGCGEPPNPTKAFQCFSEAADKDNFLSDLYRGECFYYLGWSYYNGKGTNQIDPLAFIWFQRAAELGNVPAQAYLGDCYEFGHGTTIDLKKSFHWYLEAAKGGDARSQFNVGVSYHYGKQIPVDCFEAANWYRRSADQGYASAQLNLGVLYSEGKGVPKNAVEAVKWFQKAADQGKLTAMSNLGKCYFYGDGVPKDLIRARQYLQKASSQGESDAVAFLQEHPEILRSNTYKLR